MNFIKNIPLPLIYFLTISTILMSIPFIFEFRLCDSCNETEKILTYKLDSLQNDTIIENNVNNIKKIIITNDSLFLTQNIAKPSNISEDAQIELGIVWFFVYFITWVIYVLSYILGMEKSETLYKSNIKYLPTKSKMFYYHIGEEYNNRYLKIYKLTFLVLKLEQTYDIERDTNIIELLQKISSDLDKKYFSYEYEELKNWKK